MTKSLDVQRQRARAVIAWSRTPNAADQPAPDPQEAALFPNQEQEELMAKATNVLGTAAMQGPPAPDV
jgi:hypothetical protein